MGRDEFLLRSPPDTIYAYPPPDAAGLDAARSSIRGGELKSWSRSDLALYVHVPFCVSICAFCGFVKSGKFSSGDLLEFSSLVAEEARIAASCLSLGSARVSSIFFGGGTASVLPLPQVGAILSALYRHFPVSSSCELNFEGECLTLSRNGYLEDIRGLGFERLSFGVQTLQPEMRACLNLRPSEAQLASLTDRARGLFRECAVDLIHGWPGQSPRDARLDAERLVDALSPDSIDLFQFERLDADERFMRALYQAGATDTDPGAIFQQRSEIELSLEARGYAKRSYSYFSRTSHEPVRYSGCYYGWSEGEVIGLGRGAQSFFGGAMWGNAVSVPLYKAQIAAGLLPVADAARYSSGEREGVTWPRRGGVDPSALPEWQQKRVAGLISLGLARAEAGGRVSLTEEGERRVPALMWHMMDDLHRTSHAKMAARKARSRAPRSPADWTARMALTRS